MYNAIKVFESTYNKKESDILSITQIDEFDEELSSILKIDVNAELKSYRWRGHSRSCSPKEIEIRDMEFEEIVCPVCGKTHTLDLLYYGDHCYNEDWGISCNECDFVFPLFSTVSDVSCNFRDWLFVFELLGKPQELIGCDLTLLLYPTREQAMKLSKQRIESGYYDRRTNTKLFAMKGIFEDD